MKTKMPMRILGSVMTVLAVMIISQGKGICQDNRNPQPKPQQQSQATSAEQAATIKKILSKYHAAALTAADAKAIHEQFRQAGIHAGPENNDAIKAAGFDPEKLRTLDPPPDAMNQGRPNPPSAEERMKNVETAIIKPLGLNTTQNDAVTKAYRDFFTDVEALMKSQNNAAGPPDRSKIEPYKQKRDDKIKQVLSADQYKKYLELEKASHSPGRE